MANGQLDSNIKVVREPKSLEDMVIPCEVRFVCRKKEEQKISGIYGFYSRKHQRMMYVGQANNIKQRYKAHIIASQNKNDKSYNYPLYKSMRKYGVDNFHLEVLEEGLTTENIDDREKYWIEFYNTYRNGYNQTIGGKGVVRYSYEEEVYDKIYDLLKNTEITYREISEITGVSISHISALNNGTKHVTNKVTYPVRNPKITKMNMATNFTNTEWKLKLSVKEVEEVRDLLKYTLIPIKEISSIYGVSERTVYSINRGDAQFYRNSGDSFPLRMPPNKQHTKEQEEVVVQLSKEGVAVKEISKMVGLSKPVVIRIRRKHGVRKADMK